jgi:YD repeat-containing protein
MKSDFMKRIYFLLLNLFFAGTIIAQVKPGYNGNNSSTETRRLIVDSTLHIPSGNVPGLKGGWNGAGALFYRLTDTSLYLYNGSTWIKVGSSGAGGSGSNYLSQLFDVDTTGKKQGFLLGYDTLTQKWIPFDLSKSEIDSVVWKVGGNGFPNAELFYIPKIGSVDSFSVAIITNNNNRLIIPANGIVYSNADSLDVLAMDTVSAKLYRTRISASSIDTTSLSNRINLKLNISDTAAMLANYFNQVGWGLNKSGHVVSADSSKVATKWKIDSLGALIAGGSDGNNYTTSASFTDATLTLGRNGLGNLTASFDTSRWHTKLYYDGLYQPIGSYLTSVDTSNISNFSVKVRSLFSGTSPLNYSNGNFSLAGLTGVGSNGQLIKSNGSTWEYFTPTYILPSDTASMLANYFNQVGWGLTKSGHVVSADSSKVATIWKIDSLGALIAGGGDGNNYTTSASFTDATLTLGRNGLSNLTATFDTSRWHTKLYYDGIYQPLGSYLTSIDTSNIFNFSGKVRSLINGSAPITYNNATGVIGITQSTASTNGYLNSTDWNTFNNKVSTSRNINTTFPIKGGGDLSSDKTLTLFPKMASQDKHISSQSPFEVTLNWDTLTTKQLPHWYDGTSACYVGNRLFKVGGWYSNGSVWTTDSIYYADPPYKSWSLWPIRFPYAAHSMAYTFNKARGYWVFCGSDLYGSSVDRKTVVTTSDFVTFTIRTVNYGGAERILGSVWAYDDGSMDWGFGQSTSDSSSHLDDIWRSYDDGATWTQIASGINVSGFTLGGNDANQIHYINGRVVGLGIGGKYDNNGAKRTYSKKCFISSQNDIGTWKEIDTIPIANGKQYPVTAIYNGWLWYINGHNGISNTASVNYLDMNYRWHSFNIGGFGKPSLNISHAQSAVTLDDQLFLLQGNDNNEVYVLKKGKTSFIENYKQFHSGNIYFGDGTDGVDIRQNINVGSEAANTFAEFNAPLSNRSYGVKITSNNYAPLNITSQTVSNNVTFYGANNQWYFGAGHSSGGSGTANSYLVYQAGTNYFPFAIKPNGKFILNNSSTSVPTPHATSVGRFVGLRDTTSAGTNLGRIVADGNGDLWRDTASLSISGGSGINVVASIDYGNTNVRGAISNDTLFINTFNGNNTGLVPMPDNITGKYLKDDGTWDAPSGSGDMILAATQSVTGLKTFDKDKLAVKGTSTGITTISTANIGSSNYTATLQAANGTIAYLSDITGTNSGTNTGDVTLSSENDLVLTGQALRTNKTPLSLTDGGTISWNRNNGFNAYVTLGGNRTLSLSNEQAGDHGTLVVVQDGTGGRTLNVPDGIITLNSGPGDTTIISYYYDGNVHFWKDGSSSGGVTNLDGLTDVTITSATTGDYLRYNGSAWVNAATTNITTLGTIGTGTWQGSVISSTYGGTGVNNAGRTLTINSNSGTIAFSAASKTLTVAKSLTLDGTDGTTMTFPSTSATIARTDAAQTFTGTQTFSSAPAISSISNTGTLTLPTVTSTIMGYKEASISSNATWSPDGDARENYYDITAQAAAVTTINAPSGTPANHNTLLIRVKDNGTARSISGWNAIYRAGTNLSLPTTTTISKTMYIKFIYNSTDSKWDLISVLDGL